jgi:epoxide hydrolase-like predicted phosphatase
VIDTVIFDLGQVLVRFDNRHFFERMTRYTDRTVEEIRTITHDNAELLSLFDTGRIPPEEFYERAVAALGADVGFGDFFIAYNDVFSVINPTLALARRMKLRYKLVLLSNTDVMRYSFIEGTFPQLRIFDAAVLSYRVGRMKPDPAVYIEALHRAGTAAESAVFVDDLSENVEAAKKLGITGIVYTSPEALEAEFARLGLL